MATLMIRWFWMIWCVKLHPLAVFTTPSAQNCRLGSSFAIIQSTFSWTRWSSARNGPVTSANILMAKQSTSIVLGRNVTLPNIWWLNVEAEGCHGCQGQLWLAPPAPNVRLTASPGRDFKQTNSKSSWWQPLAASLCDGTGYDKLFEHVWTSLNNLYNSNLLFTN